MDLLDFELTDEAKEMPLLDRNGNETDATLFVRGTHTADYKKAVFMLTKKMGKLLKVNQKGEMELDFSSVDPETEITVTAQRTALLITGWKGLTRNGQSYEYSKEAAVSLIMRNDFIGRQVLEFAGVQDNFFQQSAPDAQPLQSGSQD